MRRNLGAPVPRRSVPARRGLAPRRGAGDHPPVRWALVTGPRGGGRAAAVRELAALLAARGVRVAGWVQRPFEDPAGRKAIDVARLPAGAERLALARTVPTADAAATCSFAFDAAALAAVERWVAEDAPRADVVVADGLGRLELAGGGHRAAVARALGSGAVVVLSLRDEQLVYALEALGLRDEPLAAVGSGDGAAALAEFADAVAGAALTRRT
jgi:nucleoside-triphosphatase THEP1